MLPKEAWNIIKNYVKQEINNLKEEDLRDLKLEEAYNLVFVKDIRIMMLGAMKEEEQD